jgi:3-hydroxybutyryl-CoA dehydrogenase
MSKEGLLERPAEALMGQFHMTGELKDVAGAEIVFESVTEELKLKRELLRDVEHLVSTNCILTTNTSALPISMIQQDAEHVWQPSHSFGGSRRTGGVNCHAQGRRRRSRAV